MSLALPVRAADDDRRWIDHDGRLLSDSAQLLRVESGRVHLQTSDGRSLVFPLGRLGVAERAFVEQASVEPVAGSEPSAPRYGPPVTFLFTLGATLEPGDVASRGVEVVMPFPPTFAEQAVTVLGEQREGPVDRLQYRDLGSGGRQLVLTARRLPAHETMGVHLTVEVAARAVYAPEDPTQLRVPSQVAGEAGQWLRPSPGIESAAPEITRLAAQVDDPEAHAWERVRAIFLETRRRIRYRFGDLRGALQALQTGEGDCEEYSSLFVALCRARRIPARTVWVPGHAYAEFFLESPSGEGYWFPCDPTLGGAIGQMPAQPIILQKGDRFTVPGQREPVRYLHETLEGRTVKAGQAPILRTVRMRLE